MPAFQVSQSIVIDRPPEQVFDTVVDYNTWTSWSPWLGIDPDAEVTVDGDGTSPGSVYRWAGDVVGVGEIEHVRQQRPSKIEDELRFSKPFKSKSSVRFLLDRVGDGTKLTWQMDGSLPWFLFWMRPMMQRLVGMDYQRGLKMVRDRIEKGEVLSRIEVMGVESVSPMTVCGVRDACPGGNAAWGRGGNGQGWGRGRGAGFGGGRGRGRGAGLGRGQGSGIGRGGPPTAGGYVARGRGFVDNDRDGICDRAQEGWVR